MNDSLEEVRIIEEWKAVEYKRQMHKPKTLLLVERTYEPNC